MMIVGFAIASISVSYKNTLICIESEETIRSSSYNHTRNAKFFGKPENLRKQKNIVITRYIEVVSCICFGFKWRKKWDIEIFLKKVRSLHTLYISDFTPKIK